MKEKNKKPTVKNTRIKPGRLFFWSRWSNSSENPNKTDKLSLSFGANLE
ncbi:MAG: hypothetical protein AAFU57_16115 [Bacteroidota bacterium]